jgi:aquaporin Z
LTATFPNTGIGFLGVAFAFGLTVLTMAYAIDHISGCHLNPAVSVGLVIGKRFPFSDLLPYVIAQVLGGAAGAGVLYLIASGKEGFAGVGSFATNGYGLHSPGRYRMFYRRVCPYLFLPDDYSRLHAWQCPEGLRADRHRTSFDTFGRNSGHSSVR